VPAGGLPSNPSLSHQWGNSKVENVIPGMGKTSRPLPGMGDSAVAGAAGAGAEPIVYGRLPPAGRGGMPRPPVGADFAFVRFHHLAALLGS